MYGAAMAGDVRIEPGTVVLVLPPGEDAKEESDPCSKGAGRGSRKGPFSKKARSKDKAELRKPKKMDKGGEAEEDEEGQQAMEVEGEAQEEKEEGEEEQPHAPAAAHWRERYGLVQCIFEEAGEARVQVGTAREAEEQIITQAAGTVACVV